MVLRKVVGHVVVPVELLLNMAVVQSALSQYGCGVEPDGQAVSLVESYKYTGVSHCLQEDTHTHK